MIEYKIWQISFCKDGETDTYAGKYAVESSHNGYIIECIVDNKTFTKRDDAVNFALEVAIKKQINRVKY